MRLKAVIANNQMQLLEGEYDFPVPVEVPDEALESISVSSHPVTKQIRQLMGYIKGEEFDWKEQWHKHLEKNYYQQNYGGRAKHTPPNLYG